MDGGRGRNSAPVLDPAVAEFPEDTESVPTLAPRTVALSARGQIPRRNPVKHNTAPFTVDTASGVRTDLVLLHVETVRNPVSEPAHHPRQHMVDENAITLEMLKRR